MSDIILEFRIVDVLLYIDLHILFHTIDKLKANKNVRAVAHNKVYLHESSYFKRTAPIIHFSAIKQ
jgi:hypothetical protein